MLQTQEMPAAAWFWCGRAGRLPAPRLTRARAAACPKGSFHWVSGSTLPRDHPASPCIHLPLALARTACLHACAERSFTAEARGPESTCSSLFFRSRYPGTPVRSHGPFRLFDCSHMLDRYARSIAPMLVLPDADAPLSRVRVGCIPRHPGGYHTRAYQPAQTLSVRPTYCNLRLVISLLPPLVSIASICLDCLALCNHVAPAGTLYRTPTAPQSSQAAVLCFCIVHPLLRQRTLHRQPGHPHGPLHVS